MAAERERERERERKRERSERQKEKREIMEERGWKAQDEKTWQPLFSSVPRSLLQASIASAGALMTDSSQTHTHVYQPLLLLSSPSYLPQHPQISSLPPQAPTESDRERERQR